MIQPRLRPWLLAACVVGPAWAPVAAWAQAIDLSKGGPIDVTAQDGMEWRQNEQEVIAHGDARAIRDGVTVTADTLIARYRHKAAVPGASPAPAAAPATPPKMIPGQAATDDTSANEIYRLEAIGHVHIFTATDLAVGDKAIYDIDQAVLLMTGAHMQITTPQQVMTARDTMEYWSQKHMAVGRGLAVVTTSDGRRVSADVLVAYTEPAPGQPAAVTKVKADASAPAKPGGDPLGAGGKIERVEGFGHVEVRTATETIRGDRGVYVAATGIARLLGNVRITRGQNQLDGDEALVNMKTGISTLVREPGKRVQGLVMPNDSGTQQGTGQGAKAAKAGRPSSTPARKQ